MNVTRILLIGANGRMGRAITAAVEKEKSFEISASCNRGSDFEPAAELCDLAIDFSQPDATEDICRVCVKHNKPIVLGTTGHSAEQAAIIRTASKNIPVVLAPNFSIGVNALFWLTRKAAELLGPDFDLEIVEMHHRLKKDAPSGTAKRLAAILSEARKLDPKKNIHHGRVGMVGERTQTEIGIHAVRGGDIVGDHTVIFAGRGECLELAHKASSRDTYATGAVRAAKWILGKSPGLYGMEDVLGM